MKTDIGMANYEKQVKQEAAYPIPISLPLMPHVMVNVRAARRYGIYPRSFSIPDEGGARVWYVKTTEGISCTRRDAVC